MALRTISFDTRLAVSLVVLAAAPVHAQTTKLLYETQAIVTGTGEVNRQIGFEECLRKAVVKVSGDPRLLRARGLSPAIAEAASYVAAFRYRDRLEGVPIHDEQGTHDRPHDLFCSVDREKLDALLAQLKSRPWLAPRPKLVLFLSVENARQNFLLTRDGTESPYMRDSLLAAAEPLALQVDVPRRLTLSAAGIDAESLAEVGSDTLSNVATAAGGELPLVGSLVWSDEELGWIATWRLNVDGKAYRWQIRGVSFDDAFRDAVSGALQILSGNGQPG